MFVSICAWQGALNDQVSPECRSDGRKKKFITMAMTKRYKMSNCKQIYQMHPRLSHRSVSFKQIPTDLTCCVSLSLCLQTQMNHQ